MLSRPYDQLNWICTICNSIGMRGALAYETVKQTGRVAHLLQSDYTQQIEKNFLNVDDNGIALRSAITRVSIAGVVGNVEAACDFAAAMPNFVHRS